MSALTKREIILLNLDRDIRSFRVSTPGTVFAGQLYDYSALAYEADLERTSEHLFKMGRLLEDKIKDQEIDLSWKSSERSAFAEDILANLTIS